MDLLAKREQELDMIFKYSARGFLALYCVGFAAHFALRKGTMPYFKDVMAHGVLAIGGTFITGYGPEKVASEFYYNHVMISLADKYNFTPEEVMDLQRNLNQYYIKRDREADLNRQ